MCRVISLGIDLWAALDGARRKIRDDTPIEVFIGLTLVGTLSGATLRHLIEHYMTDAQIRRDVSNELTGRDRAYVFHPLRKPHPVSAPRRAALREARKTRKR